MKKIIPAAVAIIICVAMAYFYYFRASPIEPVKWSNATRIAFPPIQKFDPSQFLKYLVSEKFDIASIKSKSSDLEKTVLIMKWAHSRWSHDGSNDPGTTDPQVILEKAKGGERFRCVEYAVITAAMAQVVGLQARVVGIRRDDVETAWTGAGHVVAEVFLTDKNKWVMVDSQWARIPIMQNEPISTAEFAEARIDKEVRFLTEENKVEQDISYHDWVAPYLYYIAFRVDQRYGLNSGSSDQIILVPEGAKIPEKFQREPIKGKVYPVFAPQELYGKS